MITFSLQQPAIRPSYRITGAAATVHGLNSCPRRPAPRMNTFLPRPYGSGGIRLTSACSGHDAPNASTSSARARSIMLPSSSTCTTIGTPSREIVRAARTNCSSEIWSAWNASVLRKTQLAWPIASRIHGGASSPFAQTPLV